LFRSPSGLNIDGRLSDAGILPSLSGFQLDASTRISTYSGTPTRVVIMPE
jgi:hypothetical protein